MAIIVGYLATPEGEEALRAASREAQRRNAPVIVVVSQRKQHAQPEQVAALDTQLAEVREQLVADHVAHEIRVVDGSGDVADALVSAAEEFSADLIVIGLRRRSPVGKLILGSNAQRILLDSPCPVLAVKPAAS